MNTATEKLPVRAGCGNNAFPVPMTQKQALRYGEQNMPADLKRAGFVCSIFRSDPEIHGGDWFRINYGKTV